MGDTGPAYSNLPGIGKFLGETALDRQPTNTNFLLPTSFKFDLKRIPSVVFFCQSVNLPSITLGEISQPTRFSLPVKRSGDSFEFEDLTVNFIVDEEMKTWLEIYNWMSTITSLEDFDTYNSAGHGNPPNEMNHYSDAVLVITNSAKNPIIEVNFKGCFPKSVSAIEFDSKTTDNEPLVATVTFGYTSYKVEPL